MKREYITKVKVGMSTCGIAAGAREIYEVFSAEISRLNVPVELVSVGCFGMCYAEPMVMIEREGMPSIIYGKLKKEDVFRIVRDHIENGMIVEDKIYNILTENVIKEEIPTIDETFLFLCDTGPRQERGKFFNLYKELKNRLSQKKEVQVVKVEDIGIYNKGIVLQVLPHNRWYENVDEELLDQIINAILKGDSLPQKNAISPFIYQYRVVLRNCGIIDPENIEEYRDRYGYKALEKALNEAPEKVIEEIKVAGLRGRGGAGYPTWKKWEITRQQSSKIKYVICNADEGDPGAYMDRSILEGDPHSVIEGLIIAGYAIGANVGYFYVRAEYPLAIERLKKAINQAYENGFLGKNICGKDFSFDIEIRLGAGAFVCGEETALIASLEGKRGTPHPRPPYPSEKGLWGYPTCINNVETLANVPWIIYKGGKKFAEIGTENSKGTKVFALTGKIKNSGLIEVPMGTSIKDIVYNVGGGVASRKKIKAVQTGGPSGGVIPEKYFDVKVDYENLQELGSIMGSGGMIVMDEDDCMVDIAKFYLGFCVDESCGKCAPCRIGGYQLLNILERITKGKGEKKDIQRLKNISIAMQKASLCGLGQTAPNPVLSTLKYFEQEYLDHILKKRCTALTCRELITYSIIPSACRRCMMCVRVCPVNAIGGNREKGLYIQLDKCIKCGACYEVCKFGAIERR